LRYGSSGPGCRKWPVCRRLDRAPGVRLERRKVHAPVEIDHDTGCCGGGQQRRRGDDQSACSGDRDAVSANTHGASWSAANQTVAAG
jgi:hypothetical protein